MRLSELFRAEDLIVGFQPADKWDAIKRLMDHLVARGRLPAHLRAGIEEAVCARERSMSTGMERGIAIPHAAVDGLSKLVGVMGVAKRPGGLAFDSIDAQPTTLVVLLLVPRDQKLAHIRTLADIARLLSRDEVRTALLECNSADGAWRVLRSADV